MILYTKRVDGSLRLIWGTTSWAKIGIVYDHNGKTLILGPRDKLPNHYLNIIEQGESSLLQSREADFGLLKIIKDVFDVNYQCEECGQWIETPITVNNFYFEGVMGICKECYRDELIEVLNQLRVRDFVRFDVNYTRVKLSHRALYGDFDHSVLDKLKMLTTESRSPRSFGKLMKLLEVKYGKDSLV
jgi:hypothetical protein